MNEALSSRTVLCWNLASPLLKANTAPNAHYVYIYYQLGAQACQPGATQLNTCPYNQLSTFCKASVIFCMMSILCAHFNYKLQRRIVIGRYRPREPKHLLPPYALFLIPELKQLLSLPLGIFAQSSCKGNQLRFRSEDAPSASPHIFQMTNALLGLTKRISKQQVLNYELDFLLDQRKWQKISMESMSLVSLFRDCRAFALAYTLREKGGLVKRSTLHWKKTYG